MKKRPIWNTKLFLNSLYYYRLKRISSPQFCIIPYADINNIPIFRYLYKYFCKVNLLIPCYNNLQTRLTIAWCVSDYNSFFYWEIVVEILCPIFYVLNISFNNAFLIRGMDKMFNFKNLQACWYPCATVCRCSTFSIFLVTWYKNLCYKYVSFDILIATIFFVSYSIATHSHINSPPL